MDYEERNDSLRGGGIEVAEIDGLAGITVLRHTEHPVHINCEQTNREDSPSTASKL